MLLSGTPTCLMEGEHYVGWDLCKKGHVCEMFCGLFLPLKT